MRDSKTDRGCKPVLVLGCGNILFGDDGFGPKVIETLLETCTIPANAEVLDAGCSVRKLLFNILLSEKRPEKIIIVDAFDVGIKPGEVFEIDIDDIPENKIDDFSMHQMPTSNLLRELKEKVKIDIKIISCQPEYIPDSVYMGLSKIVSSRIPEVCNLIVEEIGKT